MRTDFFQTLMLSFHHIESSFINILKPFWLKLMLNMDFFSQTEMFVLLVALIILSVAVFYSIGLVEKRSKFRFLKYTLINDTEKKESQLYLGFLGVCLVIAEIILYFFGLRSGYILYANIIAAFLVVFIVYISFRSDVVYNKIRVIFITTFILYFSFLCFMLTHDKNSLLPKINFTMAFLLAFNFIKPTKYFWNFTAAVSSFLLGCLYFEWLEISTAIILICFVFITTIINFVRSTTLSKFRSNLEFTSEIINKGNSITLVTNKKGEVLFCSESIENILGYKAEDCMGMGYWNLTEDEDFIGEKYYDNYKDNQPFVRKLKAKNGSFKFIQWIDKRVNDDFIIGTGQDITTEVYLQNQYKDIVHGATDIIFEIDKNGLISFLNDYGLNILGYKKKDIIGKNFNHFVRPDFVLNSQTFYKDLLFNNNDVSSKEFPLIKSNGEEIWISLKIYIRRNSSNIIIGFSGMGRDVTLEVLQRQEVQKLKFKNQKYSYIIKSLSTTSYSNKQNFDEIINTILKVSAEAIGVDRVSYWQYYEDYMRCYSLYIADEETFVKGDIITKTESPNYFTTIEKSLQFVISDVKSNFLTRNHVSNYTQNNQIVSFLDTPITINGDLKGVISFESSNEVRTWDNEDVNFGHSLSDLLAVSIEFQHRLDTESKLKYKSKLLMGLVQCNEMLMKINQTNEIFKELFPIIGQITNADHVTFHERNLESGITQQKYKWGREGIALQVGPFRVYNDNDLKGIIDIAKNRKPFFTHVRLLPACLLKEMLIENQVLSFLTMPLIIKDEIIGFISIDSCTKERDWTEDELNILMTLINNIASNIERINHENTIYESEARFKLLANNIPATVFISLNDEKFTKVYINDEIENLTGYPKSDFIDNRISMIDLVHPDDKVQTLRYIKKQISNRSQTNIKYRIIKKDKSIAWVEEYSDVITIDGEIKYFEGIMIDITERVKNENLEKEKQIAEESNKAKSEFLANMSHEIRTPLNGIIGFTELLMNTNLEDFQKQYMKIINGSATTLMELVSDILDFSKIESGKLELNIEKYIIHDLGKEVTELVKYKLTHNNVKLQMHIGDDVKKFIWADYIRLKQILINLLSNAVKFTREGNIDFSVTLLESKGNYQLLRFSVKDTGIGIHEKNKAKIFEAFSQEDNTTTKKFGGTGLGLSIANKLLNLMDSKLQLESEIGVGSNFFFDLEVKTTNGIETIENPENYIKNIELTDDSFDMLDTSPTKILIVEDNSINMLLTKTLVKRIVHNAVIIEAVNGEEAIEKFKQENPDLILMDIQIPILNGYEATQEIRKLETNKRVPIIALTAGAIKGEKEKCINYGLDDYTSKPIVKENLENMIKHWLKVAHKSLQA